MTSCVLLTQVWIVFFPPLVSFRSHWTNSSHLIYCAIIISSFPIFVDSWMYEQYYFLTHICSTLLCHLNRLLLVDILCSSPIFWFPKETNQDKSCFWRLHHLFLSLLWLWKSCLHSTILHMPWPTNQCVIVILKILCLPCQYFQLNFNFNAYINNGLNVIAL